MTTFESKIQTLLAAPRPKKVLPRRSEDGSVRELVSRLRYHTLAPEAKASAKDGKGRRISSTSSTGRGERKLFYLAVEQLMAELDDGNVNVSSQTPNACKGTPVKNKEAIRKAVSVLFELAPYVGGTRDVCYLLERAIESIIVSNGASLQLDGSLSLLVRESVLKVEHAIETYPERYGSLASLLDFAATQLDQDIQLVRSAGSMTAKTAPRGDSSSPVEMFPSTLHIFIPHNGRGALSNARKTQLGRGTSVRQVVNASAEVLLWRRTNVAMENVVFQASLKRFLSDRVGIDKSIAKSSLHHIQTIIRKIRQEVNSYSRSQGFMLTDQFVHDPSKLSMSQVLKGKCGDINKLQKLATKSGAIQVLGMVNLRFASNPSQIVPYCSINDFQRSWNVHTDPMDEIAQLGQQIQMARLQKTLQIIRGGKIVQKKTGDNRQQVIASLDASPTNHLAAVFLAAAKSEWEIVDEDIASIINGDDVLSTSTTSATGEVQQDDIIQPVKLLIGNSEHSTHSLEDFIKLVGGIMSKSLRSDIDVTTFMDEDGVATTKALLNLLDQHVGTNSDLTLLTSAKVSIPKDTHVALIDSGSRVHCHDAGDDIGERLNREGAKAGDITISLAWNTFDDLDLHVYLPSGEEIFFRNKRAQQGGNACLDVDMNAGSGQTQEPVENVFIGDLDEHIEAPRGKYRVVVQNYCYHTEDRRASIPWKVVVNMNGSKQTFYGECQGEGSNVVACDFEYAGRTVPFPGEEEKEKSAFDASDLVNLTASAGQTLESMTQLLRVHQQLDLLDEARVLDQNDIHVSTLPAEQTSRPIEALPGTVEVTNRDLTDVLLAGLPQRFVRAVTESFGGISLAEACAQEIARSMVKGMIPLSELDRQGYPTEVVDAVKRSLATATAAAMVE